MATISNLSQISRYVLLSEAAYADFMKDGEVIANTKEFADSLIKLGMSTTWKGDPNGKGTVTAIDTVIDNYTVVAHQPNTGGGFSGTLFQDTASGEYVLAFRGTEISTGWPFDSSNSLRPAA